MILELSSRQRADGLEVLYSINNDTQETYAVFNHLYSDGVHHVNVVQADYTGSTLLLSKQILPWPEMYPPHNDPPAQSLIKPGASLSERIMVTLPVVVNNWVRQTWLAGESRGKKKYLPTALRRTNRVTLMIGIVRIRSGMDVIEHVKAPGVYSITGVDLEAEQIVLTKTVVLPDAVEILDYEAQPSKGSP